MRLINLAFVVVGLLLSSLAQGQRGTLYAIPTSPTSDSTIVLQLFQPTACPQTDSKYYSHTVVGNLITVIHQWPPGEAVADFGPCTEDLVLGKVPPGLYRVEWYDGVAGNPAVLRNVPFDLRVVSAIQVRFGNAKPIPATSPLGLVLLSTIIVGIFASFRLLERRHDLVCWPSRNNRAAG